MLVGTAWQKRLGDFVLKLESIRRCGGDQFASGMVYGTGLDPEVMVMMVGGTVGMNDPELSGALSFSSSVKPPAGIVPVNETVPVPSQPAVIAVIANVAALAVPLARFNTSGVARLSAARTAASRSA